MLMTAICPATRGMMNGVEQRIGRVALSGGTEVAYATAGSGPVLLLLPGWVSHVELDWALGPQRRFYEAIAPGRTLVRYDRPGNGLSGAAPEGAELADLELEVIDAVADAVGADQVDVVGTSLSSVFAVRWAARHPERIRRLVLYGGWVDGARLGDPEAREHVLELVGTHWGFGSEILTDIFAPGADAQFRAAFAALQRSAASAETAHRVLAAAYAMDVSGDLGRVTTPTRVIHREGDRAVPVQEGRRLAAGIAGAALTVLPGRAHIAYVGDVDALVDAMRQGLGLSRSTARFAPRLTPRQLQVAALVADGCSNRQIAERLFITERTAESHVDRIRERLGLRSRAQLAAWYATSIR
jgi:pimeloyl-ACP methyl ester carboxylesterase/DNA-binding CsgD family transcriptional regulator